MGVGFLVYGLGIAPAYYSWGFLAPEMMGEVGLTREQIGSLFGSFTLMYAAVSPIAAAAMGRFGMRAVVTAGSLIAAVGFWMVGQAESAADLYWSYALIGGFGLGLSTVLPAQAIPIFWFRRFRARASAIILMGAAVIGAIVTPVDAILLENGSWRGIWSIIAGISIGVAAISALLLRNHPADVGQEVDGGTSARASETESAHHAADAANWTAWQAIRTPQYAILTFAALANALPWRVFTAHGRLHFEDLGFIPTVAAAILGVRVAVSGIGRLSGSAADFMKPNRVLATALISTTLGLTGLLIAETPTAAYLCVSFLGFGFGAGYVSASVVFGYFFGQRPFLVAAGLQIAIVGVAGWIGPTWAGAAADETGSYANTFLILALLSVVGAVAIFLCRPPTPREVDRSP